MTHKKHDGLLSGKKRKINTGKILKITLALVVIIAVPLVYMFFLSPEAQVKRAF